MVGLENDSENICIKCEKIINVFNDKKVKVYFSIKNMVRKKSNWLLTREETQ